MQQRSRSLSTPEAHLRADHGIGSAVINQQRHRNTAQSRSDSEAAGVDLGLAIESRIIHFWGMMQPAFTAALQHWLHRKHSPRIQFIITFYILYAKLQCLTHSELMTLCGSSPSQAHIIIAICFGKRVIQPHCLRPEKIPPGRASNYWSTESFQREAVWQEGFQGSVTTFSRC